MIARVSGAGAVDRPFSAPDTAVGQHFATTPRSVAFFTLSTIRLFRSIIVSRQFLSVVDSGLGANAPHSGASPAIGTPNAISRTKSMSGKSNREANAWMSGGFIPSRTPPLVGIRPISPRSVIIYRESSAFPKGLDSAPINCGWGINRYMPRSKPTDRGPTEAARALGQHRTPGQSAPAGWQVRGRSIGKAFPQAYPGMPRPPP